MPTAQNDYRHLLLSQNWTDVQWSEWCEHENLIEGLNTIQPHLFVASKCRVYVYVYNIVCMEPEMYNHNNVTLFANVVLEPFFTPFFTATPSMRIHEDVCRNTRESQNVQFTFLQDIRVVSIKCWVIYLIIDRGLISHIAEIFKISWENSFFTLKIFDGTLRNRTSHLKSNMEKSICVMWEVNAAKHTKEKKNIHSHSPDIAYFFLVELSFFSIETKRQKQYYKFDVW